MARPSSSGFPFLIIRSDGGIYSYRRPVASELQPYFSVELDLPWMPKRYRLSSPKIINISLKTGDGRTAQERWAVVHAQLQAHFKAALDQVNDGHKTARALERLETVQTLTDDQIAAIAQQVRHDILDDDQKVWKDRSHLTPQASVILRTLLSEGRKDTLQLREKARELTRKFEASVAKKSLRSHDSGILDKDFVVTRTTRSEGNSLTPAPAPESFLLRSEISERLAENGLEVPLTSIDRLMLSSAVLRAKVGALRSVKRRQMGEDIAVPSRPAPLANREPKKRRTLLSMHELWVNQNNPGAKAIDDSLLYVQRFNAIFGELAIEDITREQITVFRDTLVKFPRNMTKALENITPNQILSWMADHPTAMTLSKQTVNSKAIETVARLFKRALQAGYVKSDPSAGLKFKLKTDDKVKILPYSVEDLNRLFSSKLFTDSKYRPEGGSGEAAYWLPLLALFTGARLEELGQLLTSDIKVEQGVDVISVTTDIAPDDQSVRSGVPLTKSLKTENAKRIIPIHPQLKALGFLDFVIRLRRKRTARLFPDLVGYRSRHTKNWSRWWGRYLDKNVTKEKTKNFHSFRHGFKDAMVNAELDPDLRKVLLGHANESVTDGYGSGAHLSLRDKAIQKINYPGLDLGKVAKFTAVI